MALRDLACRDESGAFRVVVEAPRGSHVKLKYEPKDDVFVFDRALKKGLTYPYDWGFVPGTEGDDGDPIDAMVLGDEPTWPGIVIPVKPIGMIRLSQRHGRKRERNDRIIAVRIDDVRRHGARRIPRALIEELEAFFVSASKLPRDHVQIEGWADAKAACSEILRAAQRFRAARASGAESTE